jgi:hypothetical protein
MNTKTQLNLLPETRVQLLTTLTAGLLASGHYTYLDDDNEPAMRNFTCEDDNSKKCWATHAIEDATELLNKIKATVTES